MNTKLRCLSLRRALAAIWLEAPPGRSTIMSRKACIGEGLRQRLAMKRNKMRERARGAWQVETSNWGVAMVAQLTDYGQVRTHRSCPTVACFSNSCNTTTCTLALC